MRPATTDGPLADPVRFTRTPDGGITPAVTIGPGAGGHPGPGSGNGPRRCRCRAVAGTLADANRSAMEDAIVEVCVAFAHRPADPGRSDPPARLMRAHSTQHHASRLLDDIVEQDQADIEVARLAEDHVVLPEQLDDLIAECAGCWTKRTASATGSSSTIGSATTSSTRRSCPTWVEGTSPARSFGAGLASTAGSGRPPVWWSWGSRATHDRHTPPLLDRTRGPSGRRSSTRPSGCSPTLTSTSDTSRPLAAMLRVKSASGGSPGSRPPRGRRGGSAAPQRVLSLRPRSRRRAGPGRRIGPTCWNPGPGWKSMNYFGSQPARFR